MPELVKGTETEAPIDAVTQNGEPLIALVVIVADTFIITWLLVTLPHENVDTHTT